MMEYRNSCSLIVNHRFNDAGQYCVNIGVMNDVSGTNTSLMVQIPGGMLPVEGSCTNIVPDWAHFKLTGSNIRQQVNLVRGEMIMEIHGFSLAFLISSSEQYSY